MARQNPKKPSRPQRYPNLAAVERGCTIIGQTKPDVVNLTVKAKLHNLGEHKTTALCQVFTIATLAAHWMVRDINQRKPVARFASYRKRNSTKYCSKDIAKAIKSAYHDKIHGKYTLNANIFEGICKSLAANYAGTLQKLAEAEKKGWLRRYKECAAFVVEYGKHHGKKLGSIAKASIFGYAFLQPKREQCEEALTHIDVLLNDYPEQRNRYATACDYKMAFGPRRRDALGTMRPETLRRLRALVQRDLDRMEQIDRIREVAQDLLRFTPPGFPTVRSGVVSEQRRQALEVAYLELLAAYTALPEDDGEEGLPTKLTEDEHTLFRELQRRAYEATNEPDYIPLRWNRADGVVWGRETALLYEPTTGRYLFLAHVLDAKSHFRTPLQVKGDLVDVNNPTIKLTERKRPSIALLYELEFSQHQRVLLDRARSQADLWKDKGKFSGAVRTTTLHAYHDEQHDRWWFEAHLAIGFKISHYITPQRVVGVHVDPFEGVFVCVLNRDGSLYEEFYLTEERIAELLENRDPNHQAQLKPHQRTAQERSHRVADALVAVCRQHGAQLGFENISYRRANPGPGQLKPQQDNSRTVFTYLEYKLPLENLSPPIDVMGVAPRRDCGHCGMRHDKSSVKADQFTCLNCGYCTLRHFNTAREVARRTLWRIAAKKAPKAKRGTPASQDATVL